MKRLTQLLPVAMLMALAATAPAEAARGCLKLINTGEKSVPGHIMLKTQEWKTFRISKGEEKIVCVDGAELFDNEQVLLVLKGGLGSPVFNCRVKTHTPVNLTEVKGPDGKTKPAADCK